MAFPLHQDTIYAHHRYTFFYELELGGFLEDLPFYLRELPQPPAAVLELGCGTGRVGRALAREGYRVTGIDLSQPMLREALARQGGGIAPGYVCMDMTRLALRRRFDAVVIPYNTMNLLTEPDGVERCLAGVRAHLHKGGRLLLQLFVPDAGHAALADKKQFQFRIFDCQDGSKVIKEILKWKEDNTPLFNLRETYRIRYRPDRRNEDWQYNYRILAWSHERWQQRLQEAGFAITASHGDYRFSPFVGGSHSTMLVAAKAV